MGVVEVWVVMCEGGEEGGGKEERSEGDSSTQPCLQPETVTSQQQHPLPPMYTTFYDSL